MKVGQNEQLLTMTSPQGIYFSENSSRLLFETVFYTEQSSITESTDFIKEMSAIVFDSDTFCIVIPHCARVHFLHV